MVLKPKQIQWQKKTNELAIVWPNASRQLFPLPYLRENCPCALCKEHRPTENPLKLLDERSVLATQAKKIEPVGNYALRIYWGDGHESGIYPFELLKSWNPLCKV
ncbi:MAG: DUF971 domain-containing protein [Deltaproteobacteria bacterium]|nr:DUF971 domain-containing protein [Deltaproteobacteria bacterium]